MGYLDNYDNRVLNHCKTKAIYKNNIMNNLANGRVISSNNGNGFVVQKPTSKEDIAKTLQKYNLPMKDVFESINVDEFVNEINANGQNLEAIVVYGLGIDADGGDIDIGNNLSDILSSDFDIPNTILNPMQNIQQSPQVSTSPDVDVAMNPINPRVNTPGTPTIVFHTPVSRNTPNVSQTLDFGSSSSSGLVLGDVVTSPKSSKKSPLNQFIQGIQRTKQKLRIGSPRIKPKDSPPPPIESTIVAGDEEEEEVDDEEEVDVPLPIEELTDEEIREHYGQYPKSEISQMLIGEPSHFVERVNALFGIRE